MVETPGLPLETNIFIVLLLKLVGAFYPQAQHVCVKIEAQYNGYNVRNLGRANISFGENEMFVEEKTKIASTVGDWYWV